MKIQRAINILVLHLKTEVEAMNLEINVQKGEVVLLPAAIKNIILTPSPETAVLEVYIK